MVNIRYRVELTKEERSELFGLISKGTLKARANLKARILLKADKGLHGDSLTDSQIAKSLETSLSTVTRVRQTFVEEGMGAVFARKQRVRPSRPRTFDGEAEAHLIALACSEPPDGYARWTYSLLANKMIELELVESVHFNTVGRTLKKMNLSLTKAATG